MTEAQLFLKLAETVGFPAVIFVVWYLYHKSQVKAWEAQMEAQAKREERVFGLLGGQLEALQCITSQNARIETKIDSSQYCPLVRRDSNAG